MKNITLLIFLVAIILVAACGLFVFEKKTKMEGADERQIFEMLKSYTLGFFLLICFNMISFLTIYYIELPFHPEILFPVSIALAVTISFEREIIKSNFITGKFMSSKSAITIFTLAIIACDFRFLTAYQKTHGIENLIMASTFTTCFIVCVITAIIKKLISKANIEE